MLIVTPSGCPFAASPYSCADLSGTQSGTGQRVITISNSGNAAATAVTATAANGQTCTIATVPAATTGGPGSAQCTISGAGTGGSVSVSANSGGTNSGPIAFTIA
ncbi:MAG: hypothetical protein OEY23_09525 [Acidimicrobiia bacterium]|nr:hypothetical protein [Acidimicrobiia bacterium]